jgi:hypothetical protein
MSHPASAHAVATAAYDVTTPSTKTARAITFPLSAATSIFPAPTSPCRVIIFHF